MDSTNSSTSTTPHRYYPNPTWTEYFCTAYPPSSWTSQRHFGPTKPHLGPLRALSLCGVWHNGADHFVVFYMCPEFWTIIDPLRNFTSPTHSMTNHISTAIATIYMHHNPPVPHLPPFHMVNRIATQNDFPLAAWSCGTIAILTTLYLTLGQIRPDIINTDIINRRHILIFHQTLLQWLILGTPPNL
jgi:hypothetical protein